MKTLLASLFIVMSITSCAQSDIKNYNHKKGIAIYGYDPVSYFDGKPTEGTADFQNQHNGITYLFSSKENEEKFLKNPEMYEPAYGGWCAYAMGVDGSKVKVDPKTYKITNGRLFLFYNFKGTNTLVPWNSDESGLTQKADQYWINLLD